MFSSIRDLSIKTKLLTLVGTFIVGLIIFWIVSRETLNLTKVNGPLYEKIVRDKDLLADILPPPLCLLEANLIAHTLCDDQDAETVRENIAVYERVKMEFAERMAAWEKRSLYPATKDVLFGKARPPAEAFFAIMDRKLIPAIQKQDVQEARSVLLKLLTPLYAEHRDAIDNLVMRTTQATLIYEAEVAQLISTRINLMFCTGFVVVLLGSALAFFIIAPILRQLRKLLVTLKAVAGGDLDNSLETTGKGEFGSFAVAVNEMITSLVNAKKMADSACQTKSEFLANMSHEIRTPLTAILGYCDVLRDEMIEEKAAPKRIQTVATIHRAGEHLMTVINDILDLSKIEADRMTTERVETELPRVIAEVESLMRPKTSSKGVELRTSLRTAVPNLIVSDPTRLRQIILNLIGNAAKFTEHGHIDLRVSAVHANGASRLRFEVEDTGCGMTPAQSNAIFRPFTQADTSVTRKHGGTGLGLTISKRLARLMEGDVELAYTEPGKGSRFVLELPLIQAPNSLLISDLTANCQETQENIHEVDAKLSGRILLAEDGEDNQHLISFILKKAGAEVTIADNGRIAFDTFNEAISIGCPFDLLLTDMQMPEMDGYTLAKTLRSYGHTIPIIALTAHAMAEDRAKCLKAGCSDYSTKPINKAALIRTCIKWMNSNASTTVAAVEVPEAAINQSNSTSVLPQVLISDLADDPDMASLVNKFVGKLSPKITEMKEHLSLNRLDELGRLAHQLKGAGGGYGFPSISEAAQRVEYHAKSDSDLAEIQIAVEELTRLCQRAVAGGKNSTEVISIGLDKGAKQ